ncbi:MAG: VCBS repeat-containing protein [Planctomycetes bacterium]|nr:VCBS repeat-containing protein [Planctomycetota bacterium]
MRIHTLALAVLPHVLLVACAAGRSGDGAGAGAAAVVDAGDAAVATMPAAAPAPTLMKPAADAPPASGAPLFTDIANAAGFKDVPGKTVVLADLNGDGRLDLVLDRRRVFLATGPAQFAEADCGIEFPKRRVVPMTAEGKPDTAKAAEREMVPQWMNFIDVDGDGDLDAVCGVHSDWEWFDEATTAWVTVPECDTGARTTVWLNDGAAHFTRGPASELTANDTWGPSMAVAAVDFDRDGRLDLFEGREYRRYGVLYGCGGDRLWKGDGTGKFSDVTVLAGMGVVDYPSLPNSSRPSYGVTVADFDNDGWPDLMQLSYGRQWNRQWRNRGDGRFTDVGMETGFAGDAITHGRYPPSMKREPEQPFRANGNTFDCAVADFDNDGDVDCFLGEIQHAWAGESSDAPSLLVNLGAESGWKFERHPVQEFLPKRVFRDARNFNYGDMHTAWIDFDLDGLQDLIIASGDYPDGQFLRLYRQRADHSFEEWTDAAGFRWEGCGGLSVGDFDRDGDPDIVVGRSFARLSEDHRKKFMDGGADLRSRCGRDGGPSDRHLARRRADRAGVREHPRRPIRDDRAGRDGTEARGGGRPGRAVIVPAVSAPSMRRRLGWVAFWAWVTALVLGCGGVSLDSLQWTTAVPATADLVGEWRPSEAMEANLREEWDVPAAPLRIVLDADGSATVDGFDLLRPDTPEWEAARASLRTGAAPTTVRGTWRVAVAQGGYQNVSLTVGERSVALGMWNLSPPYSLSATRDVSNPEEGGYLFFVRPTDESRRSALAPVADVKRDPTAGDGILKIVARLVLGTILLLVIVAVVVIAVLLVAVFVAAAIGVAVAVVAAIAAGGALGVAATSALVGLARHSLASGFRTFVTLAAAIPGAVVGTAAAWAWRRVLSGPSPVGHFVFDTPLLVGLLLGAVAGGLVGRFAAIALERLARWIGARTRAARS